MILSDSKFGNTERIAKSIAAGVGSTHQVTVEPAGAAGGIEVSVDLGEEFVSGRRRRTARRRRSRRCTSRLPDLPGTRCATFGTTGYDKPRWRAPRPGHRGRAPASTVGDLSDRARASSSSTARVRSRPARRTAPSPGGPRSSVAPDAGSRGQRGPGSSVHHHLRGGTVREFLLRGPGRAVERIAVPSSSRSAAGTITSACWPLAGCSATHPVHPTGARRSASIPSRRSSRTCSAMADRPAASSTAG